MTYDAAMRRNLRSVRADTVLGAVVVDDAGKRFEGSAASVLGGMRGELGDAATVDRVMAEGWSNGYLYFYPVPPEPALP